MTPRSARSRARHTRRQGFTLVELMVGLTAGAILLGSLWTLSSASSQFFHRESRIATTQSALRLAAEQVRRDVSRAGYLSHPDTTGITACNEPIATPNQVKAVDLVAGTPTTAGSNPVRNDILRLTGNYATGGERYLLNGSEDDLQTLRFDIGDDAFRRSFLSLERGSGTYEYSAEAFESIFMANRQVRIEAYTPVRRVFFRTIESVTAPADAAPSVRLVTPLPGSPCLDASNLTNAFISPVITVGYEVVQTAGVAALSKLNRASAAPGSNMASVLLRREYEPDGSTVVANSERVVLEYAVEFRMSALTCNDLPNTGIPCRANQITVSAPGVPSASIQGLRFFLAARTPEKDPSLRDDTDQLARTALTEPLKVVDPGGLGVGRARVRSTTFDVALLNNVP